MRVHETYLICSVTYYEFGEEEFGDKLLFLLASMSWSGVFLNAAQQALASVRILWK